MHDTTQSIHYQLYGKDGLLYEKRENFVKPETLQNERNFLQTLMQSSLIP